MEGPDLTHGSIRALPHHLAGALHAPLATSKGPDGGSDGHADGGRSAGSNCRSIYGITYYGGRND